MDKVLRSEDVKLLLVTVKEVAVFYKGIEVAIELNVYFKRMFTENKTRLQFIRSTEQELSIYLLRGNFH